MGDIMDHIEEGILTINSDLSINREYSSFLETIFGKKDLSGKNILQLVYPTGNLKEKNELKEYLNILFTNFSTSVDILRSLNPIQFLEQAYSEEKGEVSVKYLHFDFVRIMMDKKLSKIMVIIKNLTESVKKERELVRQKLDYEEELERISALLKMPKVELESFLSKCERSAQKVESFFKGGQDNILKNSRDMDIILSDLHSLKGEANLYELKQLGAKIHHLEEQIKEIQKALKNRDNQDAVEQGSMSQLMDIMVAISNYKISTKNLKDTKNRMIQRVREEEKGLPHDQSQILKEFMPRVQKLHDELSLIIGSYSDSKDENPFPKKEIWLDNLVPFLSKRMAEMEEKGESRKIFPLQINNSLTYDDISHLSDIKSSVIHLLQNALVHGIEPPLERIREGKSERGKISLTLQKKNGFFEIWVEDDGRGINLERIRSVLNNKTEMSQDEIEKLTLMDAIKIIFKSGFSSLDSADQMAGHGIGMDAVRRQVQDHRGKLMVRNKPYKGLAVCISIPSEVLTQKR
jgi:chemotaxis protein histidine kinase CheA